MDICPMLWWRPGLITSIEFVWWTTICRLLILLDRCVSTGTSSVNALIWAVITIQVKTIIVKVFFLVLLVLNVCLNPKDVLT